MKIGRRKEAEADVVVEVSPAHSNREKFAPYVEGARVRVDTARERVTPYVDTARERVTPYVEHARDWAGPRVEDAKHRAAPVVTGAVDKYVPRIEHAIEDTSAKLVTVLESTGPARYEVQRRGSAAVAALRGELVQPEEKQGRWGKRFLVLGLFTGLGAAAFAFFRRRQDDDSWITSDTTYPTYGGAAAPSSNGPTSTATDTTVGTLKDGPLNDGTVETAPGDGVAVGSLGGMDTDLSVSASADEPIQLAGESSDDVAGASPDEMVADEALGFPSETTTPDEPAERVTPKDVAEHIHHREG